MAVCGPKLSVCCMILSVWGIVQLGLMGLFYFINSVALLEDLAIEPPEDIDGIPKFYDDMDKVYTQTAYNCWIAAVLYVVVLLISVQQFRANARLNK